MSTLTTPNAGKVVEQQELSFAAGGMQNGTVLRKTVWWFLKKLITQDRIQVVCCNTIMCHQKFHYLKPEIS